MSHSKNLKENILYTLASKTSIFKSIISAPQLVQVRPRLIWFLIQYLNKFNLIDVNGRLIIHSHLPPLNSKAYRRFVTEHVLAKSSGPSHAQIGLTDKCPQNCHYCYNKQRRGQVMDTNTIKQTIQDLKQMGVFWLGFTGGEPLLNRDIVEIIESVGEECILKLFTTGEGLNRQLAKDMANAGLFYVSVSLDHHDEQKHDEIRQCKGAFRTALRAIDNLKKVGSVHVSVSTVLSKNMIVREEVEKFIEFLIELDVHEVWLSEMKPSQPLFWEEKYVINEIERKSLIQLQDEFNKRKKITVNFLGHFESKNHFGCNAGHKMVYVDPFGDVSPCVFTPISFGNVNQVSVKDIFTKMTRYFSPSDQCWINHNFELFKNYPMPIDEKNAIALMRDSVSGKPAKFFQLLN